MRQVAPEPLGGVFDPGERRAQVLLDVHGERAQRRHVQHAGALLLRRRRLGREPVDRPQERGERLPRTGGREDQRVVAVNDRRPALRLRRRRPLEGGFEPPGDGGGEAHADTVPGSSDNRDPG